MMLPRREHVRDVILWMVWELIRGVSSTQVELDTSPKQLGVAIITSNLFKVGLRTEEADVRGRHIISEASNLEYLAMHVIDLPLDKANAFDGVGVVPNTFDIGTW